MLARRRDAEIVGEIALGVDALGLSVQVGGQQLQIAALAPHHEDAVVRRAELGHAISARDQLRRAATGRHAIDARILRKFRRGQISALALFEHDGAPVGRKLRHGVMAAHFGDGALVAAVRVQSDDLAEPLIRPADIGDAFAIARPCGPGLDRLPIIGQPPRFAPGGILHVKLAEAFEHDPATIGRKCGEFRDLGLETVGRDRNHRMGRIGHAARIVDREGDDSRFATHGGDAAQLAARPEHDFAAVGRPVHPRIDAIDRPGLLQIEVERIVDHPLLPAREILDPELRLIAIAAHEGEVFAIRRRLRADRSAIAGHRRGHLARRQIVFLDLEQALLRILRILEDRAGADIAGVVDRAAIGGVDRLAQFLLQGLARALDQSDATAARNVIEPDLARTRRPFGGEMLLRRDVAPVRAPGRLVEEAEILQRNAPFVRPVRIHHPDIVRAVPVRGEGDPAAIGREARLDFPGQPFGDPGGRAARNRHGVDIAEKREGERAPIGRDIDIDPGAFVGADRDLADGGTARVGDVPFLFARAGRGLRNRRRRLHRFAGALRGQFLVILRSVDLLLLDRIGRRRRLLRLGEGGLRYEQAGKDGGDGGFHVSLPWGRRRSRRSGKSCKVTRRSAPTPVSRGSDAGDRASPCASRSCPRRDCPRTIARSRALRRFLPRWVRRRG